MKTILIVDDRPDVRALVEVTLDEGSYKFLRAETGTQALEMTRSHLPDLVLMDVMMPGGLDGYQVCELLKRDGRTSHIPVILLTARGQEFDKARGRECGADEYIVKPFSPQALLNRVNELLAPPSGDLK